MAIKQSPRSKRKYEDNFYETMPGGLYIDSRELFPGRVADDDTFEPGEDKQKKAGNRMLRQSLILIGLLVAQVILFMLLINYTVNLG